MDYAACKDDETGPDIAGHAFETGALIGIVRRSWHGLTGVDVNSIGCAHAIEIYNRGSVVEVDWRNDWPLLDALLNRGWHLSGYAADCPSAHARLAGGRVKVNASDKEPALMVALSQASVTGRFNRRPG